MRHFLTISLILFLLPLHGLSETTSGDAYEYEIERFNTDDGSYEEAAAPAIAIIISILRQAALQVGKRQVQKGFSEKAAKSIVRKIKNQEYRRLEGSLCFVVDGAGFTRVVLASDKKTVLFAGTHEAYNKFHNRGSFTRSCRGKAVGSLNLKQIFRHSSLL